MLVIYNQFNKPRRLIVADNKTPITDSILKTILETNELVKKASIPDDIKEQVRQELDTLAQYYVSEMNKINTGENSLLTDNDEYSIRIAVIKQLANIEFRINNPNVIRNHRLVRELKQVRQELNDNN